jgi:hypothetical protein
MTRLTIIALVGVLVWAVVYYAHWVLVRRRFVVVARDRVYQSGAMWPRRLIYFARRYAIETVIDFRGAHEEPVCVQARALEGTGIRHINIPVGLLPSQEDLDRFIDVMTGELVAGRRVLMHCKDGQGRAVALAAIYRIEFEGWSPQSAYRAATRLPPGFKFVSWVFPDAGLISPRNRKSQFILNYQSHTGASSRYPRAPACDNATRSVPQTLRT